MSRAVEAKEPIEIVLDADKGLESPPTYIVPALSVRDFKEFLRMNQKIQEVKSQVEVVEMYEAIAQRFVTGWKNKSVEFSKEAISDTMEFDELIELARKIAQGSRLNKADEKKSV
jgi:DNA polymerase II large subunit